MNDSAVDVLFKGPAGWAVFITSNPELRILASNGKIFFNSHNDVMTPSTRIGVNYMHNHANNKRFEAVFPDGLTSCDFYHTLRHKQYRFPNSTK